ncbi:MAG: endonuclease/exonuclease/phosphatase family protein [Bacteroidales bacterium]|nr:endonuclease/exonuclease/phosphatase family protein [Bacteroidales bacterium]MCF8332775.1 endonuclease/exonuclease/phosphatase family protein [Bacteroidales bacterium]
MKLSRTISKKRLFAFFKWSVRIIVLIVAVFLFFIVYIQVTDYRPHEQEPLELRGLRQEPVQKTRTFSILTWNIGYGGLGSEMDFFYDGGEQVRSDSSTYKKYFNGITDFLVSHDSIDIILLQEVDRNSRRSYYNNQVHHIIKTLPAYNAVFAKNYDVPFVPLPLANPLGKVEAGMMTMASFRPMMSYRFALPQTHNWPESLFMLDRAVVMSTFPLPGDKELVVMNIHNSAYVEDAKERRKELRVIKKLAQQEYQKGNYVIAGGDWNQNPPGFKPKALPAGDKVGFTLPKDFISPEWQWAYMGGQPTNRSLKAPFGKDVKTTIIDFFLVSPNLQVEEIRVMNQHFKNSDHEPVYMSFSPALQ